MIGEITFDDWMDQQTPERRAAIQQEYLKLLQREDDLKAVRQLLQQSQEDLAKKLGTSQGAVSKLERKSDMTLKNLRAVVHHLGGQLDIVIRLPNHRPIRVERLSDATVPIDTRKYLIFLLPSEKANLTLVIECKIFMSRGICESTTLLLPDRSGEGKSSHQKI